MVLSACIQASIPALRRVSKAGWFPGTPKTVKTATAERILAAEGMKTVERQLINDWRFMISEVPYLQTYMENDCNYLFALSDNGWGHGVQFFEVSVVMESCCQ